MRNLFYHILRNVHRNKNRHFVVHLQCRTWEIFWCRCFPDRTDATVSCILSVFYDASLPGCSTPPVSRLQNNLTALQNFPCRTRSKNVQQRCSRFLVLRALPNPHSFSVEAEYDIVILSLIPKVDLGINLRTNYFGISDKLDSLQENGLKNNHPIGFLFPTSYAVKIHYKG